MAPAKPGGRGPPANVSLPPGIMGRVVPVYGQGESLAGSEAGSPPISCEAPVVVHEACEGG